MLMTCCLSCKLWCDVSLCWRITVACVCGGAACKGSDKCAVAHRTDGMCSPHLLVRPAPGARSSSRPKAP